MDRPSRVVISRMMRVIRALVRNEGREFLDYFVRKAYFDQKLFRSSTPEEI